MSSTKYTVKQVIPPALENGKHWLSAFRLDGKHDIAQVLAAMQQPGKISLVCQSPTEAPMAVCFGVLAVQMLGLDKPKGQLGCQLRDQLWDQLGEQLRGQLRDQLRDQLGDQLGGQLWGKLWDQLGGQLKGKLSGQLWGQLRGQLWGQLWDQLGEQLRDQLWDQLGEQLRGQLGGQLGGQLRGQLGGQLRDQLRDQLGGQLWGQLRDQLGGQLRVLEPWNCIWDYWLSAFYESAFSGLRAEDRHEFLRFSYLPAFKVGLGFWIQLGTIVIGITMPEAHRDTNLRIHRENGPAIRWGDGTESYWWHGINVKQNWVMQPEKLSAKMLLKNENAEQRRAGLEIMGWDRALIELDARRIQLDDTGELFEVKPNVLWKDENRPARFVRVKCPSTGRVYANPVPPTIRTARAGNAWRFGVSVRDYMEIKQAT